MHSRRAWQWPLTFVDHATILSSALHLHSAYPALNIYFSPLTRSSIPSIRTLPLTRLFPSPLATPGRPFTPCLRCPHHSQLHTSPVETFRTIIAYRPPATHRIYFHTNHSSFAYRSRIPLPVNLSIIGHRVRSTHNPASCTISCAPWTTCLAYPLMYVFLAVFPPSVLPLAYCAITAL